MAILSDTLVVTSLASPIIAEMGDFAEMGDIAEMGDFAEMGDLLVAEEYHRFPLRWELPDYLCHNLQMDLCHFNNFCCGLSVCCGFFHIAWFCYLSSFRLLPFRC